MVTPCPHVLPRRRPRIWIGRAEKYKSTTFSGTWMTCGTATLIFTVLPYLALVSQGLLRGYVRAFETERYIYIYIYIYIYRNARACYLRALASPALQGGRIIQYVKITGKFAPSQKGNSLSKEIP